MVCHLLGDFELPTVPQVFGDAGCWKIMVPDPGRDTGCAGSAADHVLHVHRLHHRVGNRPVRQIMLGQRGLLGLRRNPYRRDTHDIGLERMVAVHVVVFAAFLVEAHPHVATLWVHILNAQLQGSTHGGEPRARLTTLPPRLWTYTTHLDTI